MLWDVTFSLKTACSLDFVVGINFVTILPKAIDLISLLLNDLMHCVQLIVELLICMLMDVCHGLGPHFIQSLREAGWVGSKLPHICAAHEMSNILSTCSTAL